MRTEIVEVPVTRYTPVPPALTAPLPPPPPPPMRCKLLGKPAVCVLDALLWNQQWQALLERANADRATTACLPLNGGALKPCDGSGQP